jgi:hypothetical protein
MFSLQTISYMNAQAVINEHKKIKQNATGNGHSILVKLNAQGTPDYTVNPMVFPTAASLKAHVQATIPEHDQKNYNVFYGRTA